LPYRSADDLVSIDPGLPELVALCQELSQPTWMVNSVGKILINKMPDGAKSPNLADAVCIAYNPGSGSRALRTWLRLAG
jgi:phage terminase large subunit